MENIITINGKACISAEFLSDNLEFAVDGILDICDRKVRDTTAQAIAGAYLNLADKISQAEPEDYERTDDMYAFGTLVLANTLENFPDVENEDVRMAFKEICENKGE